MDLQERDNLEAQYSWAFTCLVLAGRRGAAEFHDELLQRTACCFPSPETVEATVDEAVGCLSEVLNSGLTRQAPKKLAMSGWKRHLLALSMRPEDVTVDLDD